MHPHPQKMDFLAAGRASGGAALGANISTFFLFAKLPPVFLCRLPPPPDFYPNLGFWATTGIALLIICITLHWHCLALTLLSIGIA